MTTQPEKRIPRLDTKLPFPVEVAQTIQTPAPLELEAYYHNFFAGKRVRGEWFMLSDEDIEMVRRGES